MLDHGGARENEMNLIDFSYSSNPYPFPLLKKALRKAKIDKYPYCESNLEKGIKGRFNIKGDVAIAAGITEQIYIIMNILRSRNFVFPEHTYGEYKRVAEIMGIRYRTIKARDPSFNDMKPSRGEVLMINNPNNPTGKYYDYIQDLVDEAVKGNYTVIVDEAFIDFVGGAREIEVNDNTILMRSFSKSYNVSGIRIGYSISTERFIDKIRESRMPWGIGAIGCSLIDHILKDHSYLDNSLSKIFRERKRITSRTGLRTHTNYFMAKVGNGRDVKEKLKKNGILVRDCTSFGFGDSIRFSIKKKNENDILLDALDEIEVVIPDGIQY